jgi:hypothetical protein
VQGLIGVAVIGASMAIVGWMVRLVIRDARAVRATDDRVAGINEMSKVSAAGLLLIVPVFAMDWIGLPSWVPIAWLVAAMLVLAALFVRERRQPREQP